MSVLKRFGSAALALALTAALSGGVMAEGTEDDGVLTAGGLWCLTGFMDSYEVAGSKGFELALEEINEAGGIDGQQVNYVSYDTESELANATALITKLIEQDKADFVVGMGDPNSAIAAGTVAQEYGVPTLATTSTLPYTQERVGDTAFLVPYGDNVQAAATADYAYNELGLKTAYVVTNSTDEFTLALSKYFQLHFTHLGGEILGESTYDDNGLTDFSASAQKILALDEAPDIVFLACFTDEAPIMLKQYREAGIEAVAISGDGLDDLSVPEIAGAASDDTYFSTHIFYDMDNEKIAAFYNAYVEKYDEEPQNAFTAIGYDAAYLVKYAIENYANGDYSPASIRDAIAQVTDFEGITGTIDYSASNIPTKTVYINKFKDGVTEGVTTVVPELFEDEIE